jgi:hypothetical protein
LAVQDEGNVVKTLIQSEKNVGFAKVDNDSVNFISTCVDDWVIFE